MVHIVWIIGALVAVWGIITIIQPKWMHQLIGSLKGKAAVYFAVTLKIIGGLLFIIFARECHLFWVILILGLLITAGSILFAVFVPYPKIRAYFQWWQRQPLWFYRLWGLLAAALGGFIMYAGVPGS